MDRHISARPECKRWERGSADEGF